jgi:predicted ATP-grasp superfamily ATP-dependent carboligase
MPTPNASTAGTFAPSAARDVPALLTMTHYAGTLAAARCLARQGVKVIVAADHLLAPTLWSRSVSRRLPCPAVNRGPTALLEWLFDFGRREPGAVLYPTSDDLAWMISRHRDELGKVFRLYSPPISTLTAILDKVQLHDACVRAGVDAPRNWLPRTEAELDALGTEADAFIVKPRTQTFFAMHAKGGFATNLEELRRVWREYLALDYAAEFSAEVSGLDVPIVQEYLPGSADGIYSISGFVNEQGELLVARGSRKVLQQPSRVGVGLCFEEFVPPPDLPPKLARLCKELGYYGVFEAEVIRHGDRWPLIDFNPRYFGQMGFDIARGAPLPWMAHLCAAGDQEGARRAASPEPEAGAPDSYRDVTGLGAKLVTERLAGTLTDETTQKWRDWLRQHEGRSVDASFAPGDPMPGVAAIATVLWRTVRHPRSFWRSVRR